MRAAAVILEEINASGCTASQGHAQMYIMGTLLRHGSEAQKRRYLPEIAAGRIRLQAFGVTEPTTGSDTTQLKTRAVRDGDSYVVTGQKVWTSRALHSDMMLLLARTTPVDQVKRRSDGLSVFLIDMSAKNTGQGTGDSPDQGDDQPQHDRGVLRQFPHSGRQPDRRGRHAASATSWTA